MHIMLLGAGGFIGRYIMAELLSAGHEITCVVRNPRGLRSAFPAVDILSLDLARMVDADAWAPYLSGIDCIINTAGILRGPQMDAIHLKMPMALYAAAAKEGTRHVVLISAISARSDVKTNYSRSKLDGEEALRSSNLNWTILRPSLVYADGSYGGTSLIRGMAALPLMIPVPGNGEFPFTPIHAQDLARSAVLIAGNAAYYGKTLEPVGPDTLSLRELLSRFRAWLGYSRAPYLPIPMPLMRLLGLIGDLAGRGPISSNSLLQMAAGNAGDSEGYVKSIGFTPRSLDRALQERPAQVQDRWHARLFFLAPAVKLTLVLLWLLSALLGLMYGAGVARAAATSLGLPAGSATALKVGGSALDVVVAAVVLLGATRWSTIVQLAVVLVYTALIGTALPMLWLDPLGPLLKNIPILMLIAVHGAIGDRR